MNEQDAKAEIEKLESELFITHMSVLNMVRDEYRELIRSFLYIEKEVDFLEWLRPVTDQVIARAEEIPLDHEHSARRALCPLCGSGTTSATGFALPEGLHRHLSGWGGGKNQCPVTESASYVAFRHFQRKFGEERAARFERDRQQKLQRMETEVLLLVAPGRDPELMRDLKYAQVPREDRDWLTAEARLAELGFRKIVDGRITSFVFEDARVVVYADPREIGRITFLAQKKPLPKGEARLKRSFVNRFVLPDRLKNDLSLQFHSLLSKAMGW